MIPGTNTGCIRYTHHPKGTIHLHDSCLLCHIYVTTQMIDYYIDMKWQRLDRRKVCKLTVFPALPRTPRSLVRSDVAAGVVTRHVDRVVIEPGTPTLNTQASWLRLCSWSRLFSSFIVLSPMTNELCLFLSLAYRRHTEQFITLVWTLYDSQTRATLLSPKLHSSHSFPLWLLHPLSQGFKVYKASLYIWIRTLNEPDG